VGSVTKRFRRNMIAANLAAKVGVRMPPALAKMADGRAKLIHSVFTSPYHYRTLMLRVTRAMRERLKAEHVKEQAQAGRRLRLDAFFGGKSWLRRMIEKIFPSLVNDVRREAKMERIRLRRQRKTEGRTPSEFRPTKARRK